MSPFVLPFVLNARTKEIVSNTFIMFSNISRQKRMPLRRGKGAGCRLSECVLVSDDAAPVVLYSLYRDTAPIDLCTCSSIDLYRDAVPIDLCRVTAPIDLCRAAVPVDLYSLYRDTAPIDLCTCSSIDLYRDAVPIDLCRVTAPIDLCRDAAPIDLHRGATRGV